MRSGFDEKLSLIEHDQATQTGLKNFSQGCFLGPPGHKRQ